MKILLIDGAFGSVGNGSGMANALLAEALGRRGHEVFIGGGKELPDVAGCTTVRTKHGALQHLPDRVGAEVILTGPSGINLFRKAHRPMVLLDHGGGPGSAKAMQAHGAITCATHLVGPGASVPHAVLHPIDLPFDPPDGPGDAVVLAGAVVQKGIDVLAAAAGKLPDIPFVVINAWQSADARPDLVRHLLNVRWIDAPIPPGELIRIAKVLLCPSRSEGFAGAPRLLARAKRQVVARRIPGIVESTGDAAHYVDGDDRDLWVSAIETAWASGPGDGEVPGIDHGAELDAVDRLLTSIVAGHPVPEIRTPAEGEQVIATPPVKSAPQVGSSGKPFVVLLADVPGWAFDQNMRDLSNALRDEFEFLTLYVAEPDFREKAPEALRRAYAVFSCFHTWGIDDILPFERTIGALRSTRFKTDAVEGSFSAREIATVNRHALFQVVDRKSEEILRAAGCKNVVYLTNPVETARFKEKTKCKGVVAAWCGNAKHGGKKIQDHKGLDTIIRPACEDAGVELVTAEYHTSRLPPEAMPEFYRKASVYLCASTYEGASNAVMEAMAAGLAVVATDVGNHRELAGSEIEHFKKSGMILVDRTVGAFTAALRKLKKDRNALALGKLNAREIEERWSWDVWKGAYRDVLRKVARLDGP